MIKEMRNSRRRKVGISSTDQTHSQAKIQSDLFRRRIRSLVLVEVDTNAELTSRVNIHRTGCLCELCGRELNALEPKRCVIVIRSTWCIPRKGSIIVFLLPVFNMGDRKSPSRIHNTIDSVIAVCPPERVGIGKDLMIPPA